MPTTNNCHGCKWLDVYQKGKEPPGKGYCCHVERSQQGKAHKKYLWEHREEYALGSKERPSINCRMPDMERCELYEPGDFATRWRTEREKERNMRNG